MSAITSIEFSPVVPPALDRPLVVDPSSCATQTGRLLVMCLKKGGKVGEHPHSMTAASSAVAQAPIMAARIVGTKLVTVSHALRTNTLTIGVRGVYAGYYSFDGVIEANQACGACSVEYSQ